MANPFSTAKVAPSTASEAKKDKKTRVEIKALENLAVVHGLMKSLRTMEATLMAEVKDGVQKEYFITTGAKTHRRPDNFIGFEGIGSASCELRARSSASGLSETEQALCVEYGIPTETVSDTIETYIINPTYFNDSAMLEKVGAALSKVKGLPEDFIQKQEAKSKVVIAENGLDVLFTKSEDTIRTMLGVVGTLAIKLTVSNMEQAVEKVKTLLFPKDRTDSKGKK